MSKSSKVSGVSYTVNQVVFSCADMRLGGASGTEVITNEGLHSGHNWRLPKFSTTSENLYNLSITLNAS